MGERLDLIEKNAFRFCFVNDFPMYEYNKDEKKMDFTHNPFSMPQGGLEALNTMNLKISWLISMISSATAWSFPPVLSATTIWISWSKPLKSQATAKKT